MKQKMTFQKLTRMELLNGVECTLLLDEMPKTDEELFFYSLETTCDLLARAKDAGIDLYTVLIWLYRAYERGEYRAMHMYLLLCYQSIGMMPPHFFIAYSLREDILKKFMSVMLLDVADYVLIPVEEDAHA